MHPPNIGPNYPVCGPPVQQQHNHPMTYMEQHDKIYEQNFDNYHQVNAAPPHIFHDNQNRYMGKQKEPVVIQGSPPKRRFDVFTKDQGMMKKKRPVPSSNLHEVVTIDTTKYAAEVSELEISHHDTRHVTLHLYKIKNISV